MDFVTSHFGKDEPLTSWTLLQHICPHFWAWLLLYSAIMPKSEDKYVVKVFNWSEVHLSEMTCYKIHTLKDVTGQRRNAALLLAHPILGSLLRPCKTVTYITRLLPKQYDEYWRHHLPSSITCTFQRRRIVQKDGGGASSNMAGIICPPWSE